MHLIFDLAYDGAIAPDKINPGNATLGTCFVGQNALLNILETRLGLSAKTSHHAIRIQCYMEGTELLQNTTQGTFFATSFVADPWSSAR